MTPTVLTLRSSCAGGDMLPRVESSRDLNGISPLTILIHGYNNTACAAGSAYRAFLSLSGVNQWDTLAVFGEVCALFWPGDSRLLNAASYTEEIPRAIQGGQKLSEFLADLARGRVTPLTVRMVCHSLGNRLALECLKHYFSQASPPSLRVEGALLMAAAVLVNMVEDEDALRGAALETGNSRVLYSRDDSVLHWAFPFGEFLSGEGGGTAVGRSGDPTPSVWQTNNPMTGYGHSDYWAGHQNNDLTSEQVRIWLGLPATRTLQTATVATNPGPPSPQIPSRALAERSVGVTALTCDCA